MMNRQNSGELRLLLCRTQKLWVRCCDAMSLVSAQGLPDTLHRLEAAERRRRLLADTRGRRLAQDKDTQRRTVNTGNATGPATLPGGPPTPAPVPMPPFVAGTSFRVDLLQQRMDRARPKNLVIVLKPCAAVCPCAAVWLRWRLQHVERVPARTDMVSCRGGP